MRKLRVFSIIFACLSLTLMALGLTLVSCENPGDSKPITYTVSFRANGGSGTPPNALTVNAGSEVFIPGGSGLTKGGYYFVGWNTEPDGTGDHWGFDWFFTPTGNIILYAMWVEITYCTITFDANGGEGTPPPDQIVPAYSSITLPGGDGLTKDGYDFLMWNTEPDGTGFFWTEYTPDGDITLYAIWYPVYIPPSYTVTFNANGGDGTPPSEQIVQDGDGIILPDGNGLTRTGYTFGGWNTEPDRTGINYGVGMPFTPGDDIILYAHWNLITSYVSFNANGGDGTPPPEQIVPVVTGITLPGRGDLTRIGYTFDGWTNYSTGTNYSAGESFTPTDYTILYAKWNPITYTIAYDKNAPDATGTMANSSHTYHAYDEPLNNNGYTYAGYIFIGWAMTPTGGVEFTDDVYVQNLTAVAGETVTLYAVWADSGIWTVRFETNGGSGTPPPERTIQKGSSVNLPDRDGLTRTGYVFGGWNTHASGTGTNYSADGSFTPTTDITLYARWDVDTQTVKIEYYWVDQHGSLVTTNGGATTIIAGQILSITAQGDGYSVKQWDLNGIPASQGNTGQSGDTYYFSSTMPGKHIVGLFVEKDGKLYNTNITITVQ